MAEYINRTALLKWGLDSMDAQRDVVGKAYCAEFLRAARQFKAEDVAPVVHGKWIDGADSFGAKRGQYRVCSRCNICIPCVTEVAEPYWQYCPNCGSKNGR